MGSRAIPIDDERREGRGHPVDANSEVGTVPNPHSDALRLVGHQQAVFEGSDSRWEAVGKMAGLVTAGRPVDAPVEILG